MFWSRRDVVGVTFFNVLHSRTRKVSSEKRRECFRFQHLLCSNSFLSVRCSMKTSINVRMWRVKLRKHDQLGFLLQHSNSYSAKELRSMTRVTNSTHTYSKRNCTTLSILHIHIEKLKQCRSINIHKILN